MSGRMSSPVFVGRDEELARLDAAVGAVQEGQPTLVLVGGEAGIGKTRLVGEFTRRLDDVLVLSGGCLELGEATLPYAPLVEALRELARTRGSDAILRLLTGPRRDLRRLLPDGSDASAPGPSDPFGPSGLYEAVLSLLETLATESTVVLVLEDLHWAARSTLDLVSFLARNLAHGAVLVVATFRTDELHRRHALRPVLAELARLSSVERLDLAPLTDAQLARQVTAILGHPPHESLLREIVARSEGNAFYAEELLAASATAPGQLPPTLKDILTDRLAGLPEEATEVLRIAAAAGRRVDHELLEGVADLPPRQLRDGLRAAVAREVLLTEPDGRHYRFRHALLQEVVYDDLLPGERTRLHAAFVEALVQAPALAVDGTDGADAEIAHHARAALRLDQAYAASLRAAERTRDVFAFGEAQQHLEMALQLWPSVDEQTRASGSSRLALLRDAADAASLAGDQRRSIAHLRAALTEEGPQATAEERAALLAQLSWMLWLGGLADEALTMSVQAVEAAPGPSRERAGALAWRAHLLMLLSRPGEAVEPGREAIDLARQVGAVAEEAQAANALGTALGVLGQLEEGEALLRACIDLARELGSVPRAIRGYTNLNSILHNGSTRFDDAHQVAVEGLEFAAAHGWTGPVPDFLRLNLVDGLREAGRVEEAERELEGVVRRSEPAAWVAHHTGSTAKLWIVQGRFDDAADLLERSGEVTSGINDPQFRLQLAEAEALVALGQDRLDDAWDVLDSVRDLAADRARYEKVRPLAARVEADRVARGADDITVARARERIDVLRADLDAMLAAEPDDTQWAAQLRTAILQVEAERTRADGTPDPAAWARAEEGVAAQERVPEVGYLRMRRAEALVACDRRGDAADLLRQAHQEAVERGLRWLADQVEAVARRARVSLPGVAGGGGDPFGLTPREREVLALVAKGLTNAQIGERLFIAGKTASVHVSNILAKLGASTRGEAAAIARRHGLDGEPPGQS